VELKNDLTIEGTLYAVDQFLNLKLRDIKVKDEEKYPHMVRTPVSDLMMLDVCKKLLHQRLSGTICTCSCKPRGHRPVARCCTN
jgi:hypothetical protein